MEEKKAKAKAEDIISKLPDALISQILSYLQTKEAVRTSVLSNRWRNLWLLIPGLDLDSSEFPDYNAFVSFVDRCLDFSRVENSCLHKLKLSIRKAKKDNQSCVTHWIDFVATMCKLKHLDVECFVKRKRLEVMPVSLFNCETLVDLRLRQVLFGSSFEDSSSVSLPRLKTMRLELNIYANERSLESLISSCPVLDDLSIVRRRDDNVKVLRVRSESLTSLHIKYYLELYDKEVDILLVFAFRYRQLGVLVDAPRLKYLNFEDEKSHSKTITNSGSLTKVNILGEFDLKLSDDHDRRFFTSFSGVKDLKISYDPYGYISKIVPLPQFPNLSSLEAELDSYDMDELPWLLASCPNLRSLILDLIDSFVGQQMRVSPVPLCLMSTLEFVEIKCYFFNGDCTMELVRYFVENSVILKKLVMRWEEENPVFLSDVLALPRRSSTCQIVVCY